MDYGSADDQLPREVSAGIDPCATKTHVVLKRKRSSPSVARDFPDAAVGSVVVHIHALAVHGPSPGGIESYDTDASGVLQRKRATIASKVLGRTAYTRVRVASRAASTTDIGAHGSRIKIGPWDATGAEQIEQGAHRVELLSKAENAALAVVPWVVWQIAAEPLFRSKCGGHGWIESGPEQVRVCRVGARNEAADLLFQRSGTNLGEGLEIFAEFRGEDDARQRPRVLLDPPLDILVLEIEATIIDFLSPCCSRDWKCTPTHCRTFGRGACGKFFKCLPQREPGIWYGMKTPIEEADFLTIVLQGTGRLQKPRPGWIRIWKQDRCPYFERAYFAKRMLYNPRLHEN